MQLAKELLVGVFPFLDVFANILDSDVFRLENPPLVKSEDGERDLRQPESRKSVRQMVLVPFVNAAGVELKDGMLWYQASCGTNGCVVVQGHR